MTRLVGINHVALEVGDVAEALAFYGRFFELALRGRTSGAAFIDDKQATRRALESAGVAIRPGRGFDFLDPWGNYVQVVQYDEVQFTKTERVLRGMASTSARRRRRSPSFEPRVSRSRERARIDVWATSGPRHVVK